MFSTGPTGGFYSAAWDSYGNVLSTWTANLTAFLTDLRSYGITQVTPTPAIDGWGSTPIAPGTIYDCTGKVPLVFYQARPFGFLSTNGFPDCQGVNTAYSSANGNPYFWGGPLRSTLRMQSLRRFNRPESVWLNTILKTK
jgi:hypothetical protein